MIGRLLLKLAREKKNHSTEYMASALKISNKQYTNYENGETKRIPDEKLDKISELLDIERDLVDFKEGNIVITGNSINNGAIMHNTNNYSSELSQKRIEELELRLSNQDTIMKSLEERIMLQDKIILNLQGK